MHQVGSHADREFRDGLGQVGRGDGGPGQQRHCRHRHLAVADGHVVGDREVDADDAAQRVGDRLDEHQAARGVDHRAAPARQPVIPVGIAVEEVFGGDPGVGGREHAPLDRRTWVDRPVGLREQHPDLVWLGDLHEAAVVLEDQVVLRVVGRELDASHAG